MRRFLSLLALGCGLALLLGAGPAAADADVSWGYDLSHDLMSPFCPGRTLAACPSPQADELRLWILTQEAAGATRAEVEAMLIERYGEDVLAAPRAEGAVGFSAYAVPIAIFAAGSGAVGFALMRLVGSRRGRSAASVAGQGAAPLASQGPAPASTQSEIDRELERLVDDELRG